MSFWVTDNQINQCDSPCTLDSEYGEPSAAVGVFFQIKRGFCVLERYEKHELEDPKVKQVIESI